MSSGAARRSGGREFFLPLNAEVMFYAGTRPGAKVTVDGKEILIRPDGTLPDHFVLPEGEFAVSIVATSPDGAETRRGVLHFERATMHEGKVGSTAEPPLGVPTGRQHPCKIGRDRDSRPPRRGLVCVRARTRRLSRAGLSRLPAR